MMPGVRSAVGEAQPLTGMFPGWMDRWNGRLLTRVPLSDREKPLVEGFQGPSALFDDGKQRVLLRYTERPTRQLLDAEAVFRREDYRVSRLDSGAFRAEKTWLKCVVRQRIFDRAGEEWTSVSAWYWAALFGASQGPWWAVVTIEDL